MRNDAQMPERTYITWPGKGCGLAFIEPAKTRTEYVRFDLCASGQQVRALEWKHKPVQNPDFYIETARWDGLIYEACSGGAWWLNGQHHYPAGPDAQNIDAAKAAAQADYERRILAALTPAPQPEGRAWAIKPATIAHVIADMMERAGEPRPNGDILADVLCQVLPVALTPAPEAAQTGCLQEDAQTESAMTDSKEAVERLCRALDSKDDGTVASSFRKEAAATLRVLYQQNAALKAENDLVKRRSVPQPEGQQVKPLEWRPAGHDGQSLEASAFGVEVAYRVSGKPGDWTLTSIGMREYIRTPGYETRRDAQASGQVDFERRILATLTPAPQPEGHQVRSKILELVALIDRNIYETNLDHHRLLLDGVYHTGPVVDWAHKTLTALRDLLIEYAALTSAPDAAQTDAVPVAYARADDIKIHSSWWVQRSKSSYYSVPLYAHPAAPAPGIAEAIEAVEALPRSMYSCGTQWARLEDALRALRAIANGESHG